MTGALQETSGNGRATYRVLVVDDNQAIHGDIRRILDIGRGEPSALDKLDAELFGEGPKDDHRPLFCIDSAFQGQEALKLVEEAIRSEDPYMMAFVDVRMPPGWDGVETVSELWKVDENLHVVICTAYADYSWEGIISKLQSNDRLLIIKKPFDSIEVLQAANALTHKWIQQRALERKVENLESAVHETAEDLRHVNEKLKQEIAVRIHAEKQLKFVATHDPLTNLPNRVLLHDRLSNTLARSRRFKRTVAVMVVDLDRFKDVNDAYGHACGDALLREASERLVESVRDYDTVARLGGDEFVIVLAELSGCEECETVASRLIGAFGRPFILDGHSIRSTVSVGISMFPDDCHDMETLLKSADMAMYQVKGRGGSGYQFFNRHFIDGVTEMALLRHDLNLALENDELELHYQPLIGASDGAIEGMEALCRWKRPGAGWISPITFIPIAEQTGAIVPIGKWVLRTACAQNKAWQDRGLPAIPISVNFSARQFQQADLVETVRSTLEETGLEPRFLWMEITESTLMLDIEDCRRKLDILQRMGVRVAVDDFGAGYSSLNRLKVLPIHGLKIDRMFLQNIADDPRDADIVAAIIALAHSLQIKVIAEGVETVEQLEALKQLKWRQPLQLQCDHWQGFLFARPVAGPEATALLAGKKQSI